MRTFIYQITEETALPAGIYYTMVADCLPEFVPLYLINEELRRVQILSLNPNPWF